MFAAPREGTARRYTTREWTDGWLQADPHTERRDWATGTASGKYSNAGAGIA